MEDHHPLFEKHSLPLRISHWLNVSFLALMVWSGILIGWAYPAYIKYPMTLGPVKIGQRLAEGMGWHFFIMWFFTINGLFFIAYLLCSGQWRDIFPKKSDFKDAVLFTLHDLKLRKTPVSYTGKYNPAQRVAYTGVLLMGAGSVITGWAIYKPVQLGFLVTLLGGYQAARFEHFVLLVGFVVFFFMHVLQVLRAGWNNFRAMVAGYQL